LTVGECEVWTRFGDRKAVGGWHRSPTTLSACQSLCVDNSYCVSIDWNEASTLKCWHHSAWPANKKLNSMVQASGVDHYQLERSKCRKGNWDGGA